MNLATAPVAGAFTILQSLLAPAVQTATYKQRTATAYSTTTGALTDTFSDATVQVSLQDYSRQERVDSAIQAEDRKALIQSAQLAAAPVIGDQVVAGGETLTVVGVASDPAQVVWVLQVRRAA